jgi:NitT/TauT family transport system substrate-binding protein
MNRRQALLGCTSGMLGWAASPLGLSACSPRTPALRVAINAWIGYALLQLAQDMGQLDGASARLIEFPSNTASLLALANGEVAAAALTLDEFLQAREGGLDVQVAMVFDESHGADAVLAQAHITSLAQLQGQRIGVESTAVGALMLAQLMDAAGLQASDLIKLPLPADQHVAAFTRGDVDAVITFAPMSSQLLAAGANLLLDSSRFPGLILDVLAVQSSIDTEQAGHVRQLLQAQFWALSQLRQHEHSAIERLASLKRLAPADVQAAFQGIRMADAQDNRRWLVGQNPPLLQAAQHVGEVMRAARLLRAQPRLEHLCNPRFLQEPA